MRTLFFATLLTAFAWNAAAQAPESIKYQAIARDANGDVYANQIITFQLRILQGSSTGTNVYEEVHQVTSNGFGLVNMDIGQGTVITGIFNTIDWANDSYFLEVSMDPQGGTAFQLMGVSQFLSVPYAFHAQTAANVDDEDADTTNELQTISRAGSDLILSNNGGTVSINDQDSDTTNELQTLSKAGNIISLSDGGAVIDSVDDLDADPNNEIQDLDLVGNDLTITGNPSPTTIDLLPYLDNTDAQTLSIVGRDISITNGNTITIFDNDSTNEIQDLQLNVNDLTITNNATATTIDLTPYLDNTDAQTLSIAGRDISITGGNSITLFDNDSTNEIQDLSLVANDLTITNNAAPTTVDLSPYLDNTDAQTLTLVGADLTILNGNTVTLPSNLDNDSTNEIQDLNLAGNDLTITNNASATTIDLSPYLDNTDAQTLSIAGRDISITGGNSITLFDNDSTNEIQDLSFANDTLRITNNGSATDIALGQYTNYWSQSSSNLFFNDGFVGLGTGTPDRRLSVVDTVTNSRIASIGFSTLSNGSSGVGRYLGLIGRIQGTVGTVRGAEIGSDGVGSTSNQGGYFYAQNGGENIGVLGVALTSSGASQNIGVRGITEGGGSFNYGLLGEANTNAGAGNFATGLFGWAIGSGAGDNYGMEGYTGGSSGTNYGLYADAVSFAGGGGTHYAGFFAGNVQITGNLDITGTISKGAGTFKIDHPLDPENKYLVHSFVESPDMMNVYNGNIVTDANGMAVVELPDYVESANKDFRYQLTVVGQFAQAIVKEKISGNRFVIQTDKPNVEVSWQVTGIRNDPYAQQNRIEPETEKAADDKGKYLHPKAYGKSEDQSIYQKHMPDAKKKEALLKARQQSEALAPQR